LETIINVG